MAWMKSLVKMISMKISWHEHFTVIKFYSLPQNRLNKKLMDFNFMKPSYMLRCHGSSIVDFHVVYDFNFIVLLLTIKP